MSHAVHLHGVMKTLDVDRWVYRINVRTGYDKRHMTMLTNEQYSYASAEFCGSTFCSESPWFDDEINKGVRALCLPLPFEPTPPVSTFDLTTSE